MSNRYQWEGASGPKTNGAVRIIAAGKMGGNGVGAPIPVTGWGNYAYTRTNTGQ